jgi:hypothetical protein
VISVVAGGSAQFWLCSVSSLWPETRKIEALDRVCAEVPTGRARIHARRSGRGWTARLPVGQRRRAVRSFHRAPPSVVANVGTIKSNSLCGWYPTSPVNVTTGEITNGFPRRFALRYR